MKKTTDTQRLNWLIHKGYSPAKWRQPTFSELRAGEHDENGMVFVKRGGRKEIDKAMKQDGWI